MPRTDLHEIEPHLLYLLSEVAEEMPFAFGQHYRMILDEQYTTLARFLSYPHCIPKDSHE